MDAVDSTATRDEGALGTLGPGATPGDGVDAGRAELTALTLPQLRRRRDLLGAELRRAGHWRRLLRARRDLLTAAAVAPEALTVPVEAGTAHGPLETHLRAVALADHADRDGLPADPGHDLADLTLLAPGCGGVGAGLAAVTTADRRLAAYTEALAGELELATEVLVARVRAEVRARGAVEVRGEIASGA